MGILDRNQMGVVEEKKESCEEKKESGRKNNMFKLMIIASLIGGVQGCREKDEPKIKKEDHKTIVLWNLNSLPESVAVDTVKNVITVPYEMTEKEIKRMIEKIVTVKDADAKQPSDVGIKTIAINEEKGKITITCFGVNGEDGKDNQTTETYELKRLKEKVDSPTTYVFPEKTLPGVEVDKENKIIKYPPKYTAIDIKTWVESGTAEDPNGGAEVKGGEIVQEGENKVLKIILSGRNGKTGKDITTEEKFILKKGEVVAEFPDFLPGTKNNRIVAGDEDFFTTLFQTEISLNTGEKQSIEEVTVNGQKIIQTDNHIIHVPKTYEIVVKIKGKDGKIIEKIYQLIVEKEKIVTNDLSGYTQQVKMVFPDLTGQIPSVRMKSINAVSKKMKIGVLKKVINIFKLSGKKIAMVESQERDHKFKSGTVPVVSDNSEIDYIGGGGEMPGGGNNDPDFPGLLENTINNYDMVMTEANSSNNYNTIIEQSDNSNKTVLHSGGSYNGMEQRAKQGLNILGFPIVVGPDGMLYSDPKVIFTEDKYNPLINNDDSNIFGAVPLGGESGGCNFLMSVSSLMADLYYRLDKIVNKEIIHQIYNNYPQIRENVKYSYYSDPESPTYWKTLVHTNKSVMSYINGEKFVVLLAGAFDLNPDLEHLEELGEVPLFKYWDKIKNYDSILIEEKKGVVTKIIGGQKVLCVNYRKLLHQGIKLADLKYNILVRYENRNNQYSDNTYIVKLINWNINSGSKSIQKAN